MIVKVYKKIFETKLNLKKVFEIKLNLKKFNFLKFIRIKYKHDFKK